MDSDKCNKCEFCHIIRQDQFGIYLGCYKDYNGKWVAEIDKCPECELKEKTNDMRFTYKKRHGNGI